MIQQLEYVAVRWQGNLVGLLGALRSINKKMVQTEQEAFVVVAFPEQMSSDVLAHEKKLLQIWRQFFYVGRGSEGF